MSIAVIGVFLWLADIVESLGKTLVSLGIIASAISLGVSAFYAICQEKFVFFTPIKKWLVVGVISLLLGVLVPSKNTMYMIGGAFVGVKVVEKVANSEEYKKLMELFNLSIDKALVELKKDKK